MISINKILESLKKKEQGNKKCNYKLVDTSNERKVILDCKKCSFASDLNDKSCLDNIIHVLLKEPYIDRLVLSHLYEREYEKESLMLLKEFAYFCDFINAYTNATLTENECTYPEKLKCQITRTEIIDVLISQSSRDPLQTLDLLFEQNGTKLQGHILDNLPDHSECYNCIEKFNIVMNEIKQKALKLKNRLKPQKQKNAISDYNTQIRSYVRPSFSTSRIYAEPPDNTEFIECYDIQYKKGRELEISIYAFNDRPEKLYFIKPFEYFLDPFDLSTIERIRKKIIRHRPDDLSFADPANSREYFRQIGKRILLEDAELYGNCLKPSQVDIYSDLLAKYTSGLGILEDILSDHRVTDVYINAPADSNPVNVVIDDEECVTNVFLSQNDLDSMVSRFRAISGRPFGEATPVLEMKLNDPDVRVSVIGDPLSSNGLAYAFRKHAHTPWTLPKLINSGTISPLAAGLLSFMAEGQSSILIAGDVGAGKTSLLCSMIAEIPQKYRILTIEDTPEIPVKPLQNLGWKIQGMNSQSSIMRSNAEMTPEVALRAALRLGNSSLVIGEVRGTEVRVLYEAMQVGTAGNSVMGTIHGASAKAVYERIINTLKVPSSSFKATDAIVICSSTRTAGEMTRKKRVTQIAEVNDRITSEYSSDNMFSDLFTYSSSKDSLVSADILDRGQSALVNKIASKMGISIDDASKNIQLRAKIKENIAEWGNINPEIMEIEALSIANNMFWLLMDEQKQNDVLDYNFVFKRWLEWFEDFAQNMTESHLYTHY